MAKLSKQDKIEFVSLRRFSLVNFGGITLSNLSQQQTHL